MAAKEDWGGWQPQPRRTGEEEEEEEEFFNRGWQPQPRPSTQVVAVFTL
jgi:hypothetical protein